MSNVLTFPRSVRAVEWIDDQPEPMEFDAKRARIQAVIDDVLELRSGARQGLDDAIAALEQGHARLRNATLVLEDHLLRTKFQSDLGLLEQLLDQAKGGLSALWSRRV